MSAAASFSFYGFFSMTAPNTGMIDRTERLSVRLRPRLKAEIEEAASASGVRASDWVRAELARAAARSRRRAKEGRIPG